MFDRLNGWTARILLGVAACIIFLVGFLVCADVIGRVAFNAPVKGTPEMVSMSIVIICFLLAGYSVHSGSMIQADIVVSLFGERGRAFAQVLSAVLGIGFFGLVVWGSIEPTSHAWFSGEYEGEGAMRVPVWPARTIVLFGSALVVLAYLSIAIDALARLFAAQAPSSPPASRMQH